MVNISFEDRICNTCKNADICKYHDSVMKEVNRIKQNGANYPLKITLYCKHYRADTIERGFTNEGDSIDGTSKIRC